MSNNIELRLQELDHQLDAIRAVTSALKGVEPEESGHEQNPVLTETDLVRIRENIATIQKGEVEGIAPIPSDYRTTAESPVLGLDVRMETGTGKTYTFTRLMYELHEQYGFNKFILLAPSTAIREGTKNFISSDYAKKHFADIYPGRKMKLEVMDAQKKGKRGRDNFPRAIDAYSRGTNLDKNSIHALLMTSSMLTTTRTMGKDYDSTVFGSITRPYDALRASRPIVIIDEPHRFSRSQKAFEAILHEINPQIIIRFGATFPREEKGRGKQKQTVIDYDNLIYNLGPAESFNRNLVKGITVNKPGGFDEDAVQVKLMETSAKRPKTATFRVEGTKRLLTVGIGASMSDVHPSFSGITIDEIGKNTSIGASGVTFSNDHFVATGSKLIANVYSTTYQEIMLQQALDNHFDIEWEMFNRGSRIKALTLFFIDSVTSYRGEDQKSKGPLRVRFEDLLAAKTREVIEKKSKDNSQRAREYTEYLKATLENIAATNEGYFSVDNSTKDEEVKAKIDLILRDKERLLSFKNEDGSWNPIRFIFSKWTLKEGWDNPNVFQIAKLRSSGSEVSKLQEVGRGLRLPVDELGNRISDEEFDLTYLIDFTEKNFAEKLINDINGESIDIYNVNDILGAIATARNVTPDELFGELLQAGFINRYGEVKEDKREELYESYPEFNNRVQKNKVKETEGREKKGRVSINYENFDKLKNLWQAINKKYVVTFEEASTAELDECMDTIMSGSVYRQRFVKSTEQKVVRRENSRVVSLSDEVATSYYKINDTLAYGEFLKRVHKATSLPLDVIHRGLIRAHKEKPLAEDFFNRDTADRIVDGFREWFMNSYSVKYSYKAIDHPTRETVLTDLSGRPKRTILQGTIGRDMNDKLEVPENYLYDAIVFDSPKEESTIVESGIKPAEDRVVVYGKIPSRSIRVPVYFGGTMSPDFMYVIEGAEGAKSINLIVETKDVEIPSGMRGEERNKVASVKKFFEALRNDGYPVQFQEQLHSDKVIDLIHQVDENAGETI